MTKQQILDVMKEYMTSSYDNGTINDGGIQGGEEAADAILNLLQPEVISRLQSLTRYDSSIGGGCDCCGSWVEHEKDQYGDWVKFQDIEVLIEQLRANGL